MNNRPRLQGASDGKIRWGILGTGRIAALQVRDLLDNGFTVQAVGSRAPDSSKSFSCKFGIPTAHGSYQALVSDPAVDVVYVASPHPYHRSHALLALNAGKHVLVEKPFAMNAREAKEIVETAKEQELVVLEAMWTRHLPHMARVRSIINAGTLGQVRKVVASHNQSLPRDPRNRLYDPALGGGALLDLGIYPVGLAFDLLGTPSSIQASASMTATGVDRQTTAIFQYDNGQQALLDCDLDAAGANRAVIIGTEGWIDIDSIWYTPTSFTVYDTDGRVMERFHQPVAGRGMQFQAMTMERLIRGDSSAHAEPIAVMHAMDEIRRQIGLIYAADAPTPAAPTLDMSPGIHR